MSEIGSSPCPNGGSGPLHKPDLEGIDEHALRTPLQQALQVRLRTGRAADLVHIFNIKIDGVAKCADRRSSLWFR